MGVRLTPPPFSHLQFSPSRLCVSLRAFMGSCLSTVFPHGMRGTSRRGSPNGSKQLPRDEGSVPLPKDEGNTSLPNDEDTLRLPKDEGNSHLPKDDDTIRLPKNDDHTHLPKVEDDTRPPTDEDNARLPDVADKKTEIAAAKRRALLVGICYSSPTNTWSPLDGPHGDVDRCEELLTSA